MLSKSINVANQYRWDSEFYLKKFIFNENKLNNLLYKKFASYTNYIKKGIFDLSPLNYKEKGIPFIRTSEIKNPTIDFSMTVFLDKTVNKENCKTILKPNDLVFTKIGAYIGDVAKLPSNYTEYNFSQNVVGVSLKNKNQGAILLAFFLSKFGKLQILRSLMLSGQGKLELIDIRNYKIPDFSNFLINYFNKLFIHKEKLILKSQQLYTQAEELLLAEVGLKDFSPSTEAVNIKSFSESFGTSGRLDAEYYQPKYEEIERAIKNYANGFERLDKFINNYSTGYPYKSSTYINEDGIPLIRINNIYKGNLDISNAVQIPLTDEKLSPKDIANENDILISMSGTIGNSCKIPRGIKALVNQRIMRITSKNFNHEVLPLLINSPLGMYQLNRIGTGGVQTNISSTDIKNILIPKIRNKKQQQIADLVEQSFTLKAESEHLLAVAKRAVEIAIEQDEAAALAYIASEAG